MTGEKLLELVTASITISYPDLLYFHCPRVAYMRWRGAMEPCRGFPDLVILGPRGIIYRECKGPVEELSKSQVRWKWKLQAAGLDWGIWRPKSLESGRIQEELEGLCA